MMKFLLLVLLAVSVPSNLAREWWRSGNFYQIYPRSFKDSDGDGIGDLNGITSKLDYLKHIGITGAWLSPIFQSPMVDFGYDISDYTKIQPEYGTIDDFNSLMSRAQEIGLRIILDFVPNHTSDEHEWFKKSVKRDPDYENFYMWHDGVVNNVTGKREPPNNWISSFRYSAWEWNDEREQYYYHQFSVQQPDLNYREPKVGEAMKNILRYWLANGVNGFRVDAVPFIFEDIYLRDEPISGQCSDTEGYCYHKHIYTQNQNESFDLIYQWRDVLDEYTKEHGGEQRIMMTEAYTALENSIILYGTEERPGAQIPFNFEMIKNLNNNSTAKDFQFTIDSWLDLMPKGVDANWVLGNHDNNRLTTRYGIERADLLNILLQTLPGIAITYYGEEIAMTDAYISWKETVDPQACNTNSIIFNSYSRDPERTPFQWDNTTSAGFSTNPKTWLPVASDYEQNNVRNQLDAPNSHLKIFKTLTNIRKTDTFVDGSFKSLTIDDDILLYTRELDAGKDLYVVVLNFGKTKQILDVTEYFPNVPEQLRVVTSSLQSEYSAGDIVSSKAVIAYPQVGTVLVGKSK